MERAAQPHVIRRQILEIVVSGSESDGLALQRRLPGLCEDRLLPSLDSALNRLVPGDEHWLIDRLDIDAGSLRPEVLERGLIDAVIHGVERYLREHAPPQSSPASGTSGPIGRRSGAQRLQDALLHFLETGLLPWWFRLPPGMTLEALIRESWHAGSVGGQPRDFAAAVTDAIASATVRARLVRQFSPEFLGTLLGGLGAECASAVRDALEELTEAGIAADGLETFSDQLWQTAFLMGASGERPTADAVVVETLRRNAFAAEWRSRLPLRFARLWPGGAAARELHDRSSHGVPDIRKPTARVPARGAPRDEAAPRIDLDEGVYINCAGIVLLHPFLERLFEGVGVARDGKLLEPDRALCLMHFLATGQRVAPEYDLLLPKLLCNVPPETPVDARIALTPVEEEEAAALLAAVVRHWDALGDTSADGLRGTFLVRPGRLSRRDGADVLQVEERSVDVLLDRLPWGISVMQLPWMERPLWVEWRF
jgi:hypothetical protein